MNIFRCKYNQLNALSEKINKDPKLKGKIKVDLEQKSAIAKDFKLSDFKTVLTDLGVPTELTTTALNDINNVPIKEMLFKETADNKKELILKLDNAPVGKFLKPIISALGDLKVRCRVLTFMFDHFVPNSQCIVFEGARSRR